MRRIAVLVVFLLCSVPAFGQSPKPETPPAEKSKQAPPTAAPTLDPAVGKKAAALAFVSDPFDSAVEKLPPRYAGHNCGEIAEALKKAKPEKDEFETTDAYNKRIEQVKTAPLIGTVGLADQMAFISTEQQRFVLQKYNADAQTLQVTVLLIGSHIFTKPSFRSVRSLVIDVRDTRKSSHTASNAYGKTVIVNRTVRDVCGLIFDNRDEPRSSMEIKGSFQVEQEEARSLREDLSVLYVGNVTEPYYTAYSYYRKPTIDVPLEMFDKGAGVVFRLKQVWFFNRATGKVYARIDG